MPLHFTHPQIGPDCASIVTASAWQGNADEVEAAQQVNIAPKPNAGPKPPSVNW
jgi:hypothetical protein